MIRGLDRIERPPDLTVLAQHHQHRRDYPGGSQWWEEELLLEIDVPTQRIHCPGQLLVAYLVLRETLQERLDAGVDLVGSCSSRAVRLSSMSAPPFGPQSRSGAAAATGAPVSAGVRR